jgi:hypothetical protein
MAPGNVPEPISFAAIIDGIIASDAKKFDFSSFAAPYVDSGGSCRRSGAVLGRGTAREVTRSEWGAGPIGP